MPTCWDSDRPDLGRVGVVPNPELLGTLSAKSPAFIQWAHERAGPDDQPSGVDG
jgi:hypothetical protein